MKLKIRKINNQRSIKHIMMKLMKCFKIGWMIQQMIFYQNY